MRFHALVVVPTLNEAATIDSVLAELRQGADARLDLCVVVADGGSQDGTPEIVRRLAQQRPSLHPHLHLLHNPKRLQSAAINLAVKRFGSSAPVLVRCDAHAHYPSGFVSRLLEALADQDADAVVVPMDTVGDTCLRRAIGWVSDTPVGSGGSAHRGGRVSGFVDHGHHAGFRMDSFIEAGGYDESFSHNEDAELDCRQRALGKRIYLDAAIRLRYLPRASLAGLWRQYFHYGRGRSRTVRKHPQSLRLRQFLVPAHLAASCLALVLAPWQPLGLLWPALYLALLAAVGLQLAWRHRSACGLLAAPAAFVMHTAWACGFGAGLWSVRERSWRADMARPLDLEAARGPAA
jgi:succinoglycan biosynthesis protein ExoA